MRNWVSKIGIEFSQIELSWYFLFDKTWNLRKENKKQFWNFLNHLEVQEWLVNKLSKTFGWRCWEGLASHYILFPSESLEWQNAYGCYDANKETKSKKILRIFRYQVRAVTTPPTRRTPVTRRMWRPRLEKQEHIVKYAIPWIEYG